MWLFGSRDNRLPFAAIACVALCTGCNSREAETEKRQVPQPAPQESRDPLRVLASVVYVILDQEGITNDDLPDLEMIPNLRTVVLESPMNDESVAALTSLRRLPQTLERMDLIGPQFTNESVRSIAAFTELRRLDLDGTSIDDTGVALIESMGLKLQMLSLNGCEAVTDAAIPHLEKLEHLETLDIQWTAISAEGAERLMTALPNTTFRY